MSLLSIVFHIYVLLVYAIGCVYFKTIAQAIGPVFAVVFLLLAPVSIPLALFIFWVNS